MSQLPTEILQKLGEILVTTLENKIISSQAIAEIISFRDLFPRKSHGLFNELSSENEFRFFPKKAIIANLIGRIGYSDAVPFLTKIAMQKEENKFIRGAAIEALGELKANSVIPILLGIIQDKDEPSRVIVAALISLGWIGAESTARAVLNLIYSDTTEIWIAAIDALHNFHSNEFISMLFKTYIEFVGNESVRAAFRGLLIEFDLVPLINSVADNDFILLEDLILRQGAKDLQKISHLADFSRNSPHQNRYQRILDKLVYHIPINHGLEIYL